MNRVENKTTPSWLTHGINPTPNEGSWIEFIRLITADSDPPPTFERVQRLRTVFQQSSGH
ncbi:hypothetical protein EN866_24135 [Mesorhizobium sp. M2D.F.Ca.ET.223.01.1.1]|nr:hypothetical protein EN864_24145 [bacterium M00.F.Ca.ET.221.01.1.1]TGR88732.1 hypothetical protein EN866_24135 [Mesorhizobium sp. M2D.F.Ca.ET.223.01.1.1]